MKVGSPLWDKHLQCPVYIKSGSHDKISKVDEENDFLLLWVALGKKDPQRFFDFSSNQLIHTAKMELSWTKDSSAKNLFEKFFQKYPVWTFQKGTSQKVPARKSLVAAMGNGAQSQWTSSESVEHPHRGARKLGHLSINPLHPSFLRAFPVPHKRKPPGREF